MFAAVVVATYAAVGLGAGWAWHELWQPSDGVVFSHQWYLGGEGLRRDFAGTGLYVLVGAVVGLVLGGVFAMVGGVRPVLTLGACLVGSVLAAWLMLKVGERLGPADPQDLAKSAEDGTHLASALRVTGPSPLLALPFGTLAALALVFTVFPEKTPELRLSEEPQR
jgi:hypothetical protein